MLDLKIPVGGPDEIERIRRALKEPGALYLGTQQRLLEETDWEEEEDGRVKVFGNAFNVHNSAGLGLLFLEKYLTKPQWWSQMMAEMPPQEDRYIYRSEFLAFIKIGFVHALYSVVEAYFRSLAAELPGVDADPTESFANIYRSVLSDLGIGNYVPLLDLYRHVRNTVHHNGMYLPDHGEERTVEWDSETYRFVPGEIVEFVSWDFLIDRSEDLHDMLEKMVDRDNVQALDDVPVRTEPEAVLGDRRR